MPSLTDHIDTLADSILEGQISLDDALYDLADWLDANADNLSPGERHAFSATLDQASQGSNESLVDSILRLHTTRLLYRHDKISAPPDPDTVEPTPYAEARSAFADALQESEDAINETRIDIAIANAQHLLGDIDANRRWLDTALDRLPPVAATDLVALAQAIPAMPMPRLNWWRRFGLKLIGYNFERLAARNRASLTTIARMQTDQIVIMAHLVGTSYEAIRERQRAHRALRIAAHLITRHDGMHLKEADQLRAIAADLQQAEREAAVILLRQANALDAG
jgi:tetratricopeptide (TPR) repeat protein